MRGAPNSLTCHFASKLDAVMVEDQGSVLPMKLGLGQSERNVAARSLPPCRKQSEPVPRRLTMVLKLSFAPVASGTSGAAASTVVLPRQTASLRIASRQGCHC